eukprot:Anaeramoba_ignava/c19552_g1_i1.p2 GENE.c19552_g1_i1~~c19552_g1_i1.p2  ORF type:complete len:140 (+),score=40.46 c19552_g1_i1:980-1399(+)
MKFRIFFSLFKKKRNFQSELLEKKTLTRAPTISQSKKYFVTVLQTSQSNFENGNVEIELFHDSLSFNLVPVTESDSQFVFNYDDNPKLLLHPTDKKISKISSKNAFFIVSFDHKSRRALFSKTFSILKSNFLSPESKII